MATSYLPPARAFTLTDGHVEVADTEGVGKVSGTHFGAVLGLNPYKSPFGVACDLFGLAEADLGDNPAVQVGKALETPLIEFINTVAGSIGRFIPVEDIKDADGNPRFKPRTGPHNEWAPDFDDDVFTGHIDGMVEGVDGQDYILEVKTSRNMHGGWFVEEGVDAEGRPVYRHGGAPDHYYWQIALYNEFTPGFQKDRAYLLVGKVGEAEYADALHAERVFQPVEGENVFLLEIPIDREEVARMVESVRGWYAEYILNGVSPDCTDSNRDTELWSHLTAVSSDEGRIQALVDRMSVLATRIEEHDREVEADRREFETAKDAVKEYLDRNGLPSLLSQDGGYTVTLSAQTRTKYDVKGLLRDHPELADVVESYRTDSVVKTFKTSFKKGD